MNTVLDKYKVLTSTKIGWEFEFYSELTPKEVVKSVSLALNKIVKIPVFIEGLNISTKAKYHSDFEPTSEIFKIERDFSGGKNMYELITGPMSYGDSRTVLIKMFKWIQLFGKTNDKCSVHMNISFDNGKIKTKYPLMNLNALKFILGFDEEKVYKAFPNRRNSVYAKTIYNIYPNNKFAFFDTPTIIDSSEYITPKEKYYGVNFTKLNQNYLEFRYCGGEGYENKSQSVLDLMDYFITSMYNTLQNNFTYIPNEIYKLHDILKNIKKISACFSDPKRFFIEYPEIRITIDLKGDYEIVKSYWIHIRDVLFVLVNDSRLSKGHYNFDTDMSAHQLRRGSLVNANNCDNIEFIDCILDGIFYDCKFYDCIIKSSRVERSILVEGNEVLSCKLTDVFAPYNNIIKDSYILNLTDIIDCKVEGGVIRKSIIGENAEVSDKTLIVETMNKNQEIGFYDKNGGFKNAYFNKSGLFDKNSLFDKSTLFNQNDLK